MIYSFITPTSRRFVLCEELRGFPYLGRYNRPVLPVRPDSSLGWSMEVNEEKRVRIKIVILDISSNSSMFI